MKTRPFSELVTEVQASWSPEVVAFHEQAGKYFTAVAAGMVTPSEEDSK